MKQTRAGSQKYRKGPKAGKTSVRRQTGARSWLRSHWLVLTICFSLILITWLIFGPTLRFGFINYDDSFYVYQNHFISDGLTWAGFRRYLTHSLVGNWHPLTSLSLMLDAQLFGLNAGGYHEVNVILQSIVVLLLFLVLRAMTAFLWRSALVAALFAFHPLRAESVVWISERKDVLSGVFFFLCLAAYLHYARKPGLGRYLLVAVALTLGLMAKAMLVTLPFLLLVLDYWPLRRFPWTGTDVEPKPPIAARSTTLLILEKLPLLIPVIAISAATIWAQEPALEAAENWSLAWRVENALVTIWIYIGQFLWPVNLAIFYPHPKGSWPIWWSVVALIALLLVSAAVLLSRRKAPYLVTGWFWYLGMLVPVIGLVQVGWQGHADRYTYLPQIGLGVIIAWGAGQLVFRWPQTRTLVGAAVAVILVGLVGLSWRQVTFWSSSIAMWRHTLAITRNNDVAERGLGTALLEVGQVDEAIEHDRAALRIRPHDANGMTNLANALLHKKEYPEAIELYREVLTARPNDSEMHRNLGKALYQSGQVEQALAQFHDALRLQPNDSDAAYSLGNAYLEKGDPAAAIPYFREAIKAKPQHLAAHYNLAIALQRDGQLPAAIAEFRQTLQLAPQKVDALNNLAIALLKSGDPRGAMVEWKQALEVEPGNAEMHNNLAVAFLRVNQIADAASQWRKTLELQPDKLGTEISLAWILSTAPVAAIRNGNEALDLAQRALQQTAGRQPMVFRVLAAAQAEAGQFATAIQIAEEGQRRAEEASQPAVASLLQGDLELYRQNVPLRDPTYGQGASR